MSSKLDMFLECWRHKVEILSRQILGLELRKQFLNLEVGIFYIQGTIEALEDDITYGVCKVREDKGI